MSVKTTIPLNRAGSKGIKSRSKATFNQEPSLSVFWRRVKEVWKPEVGDIIAVVVVGGILLVSIWGFFVTMAECC